jgi:hypothetical protein
MGTKGTNAISTTTMMTITMAISMTGIMAEIQEGGHSCPPIKKQAGWKTRHALRETDKMNKALKKIMEKIGYE